MSKLLRDDFAASEPFAATDGPGSALLLEVLWRRRWTLALTILGCVVLAGVFVAVSTPIYSATARVVVEQHGPTVMGDKRGFVPHSEGFIHTQVDAFQSNPVLARAVRTARERSPAALAGEDDPVAALRQSLKVEPGKRSEVVAVTVESPDPQEAAVLATSLVDAYVASQTEQQQGAGQEMLAALRREQDGLVKRREAILRGMLKYRQDRGVLTLRHDRDNPVVERATVLSGSLTNASVGTIELRAQLEAIKTALPDPASLRAFVQSLQSQSRDFGDREYDDLRAQLTQHAMMLWASDSIQGSNHPRIKSLQVVVEGLRHAVAEKERAIAQAHLVAISTQLASAEAKERQLAAAVVGQQGVVAEMIPDAVAYERLESEAAELQRQVEQINARIVEVNANVVGTPPLNVRVLEPARAGASPVRPRRALALAAGGMAGCVLGIGLAMLRERRDLRVRSTAEVSALLRVPVLAVVPQMNARLSPVARGQIVFLDPRSPSAEAYRSARTSLSLGSAREARTILVASPGAGDGKSSTASNLAIAFAQAGHRTLLIDCDLRQPVQHLIFELPAGVGLTSVVAGEGRLRDAVRSTRVPGLYVLPCGPIPPHPSELLAGKQFARLMRTLTDGTFDRIVIDSPPLAAVTDARELAADADATLLVLRMNQSARDLGVIARDGLEEVGANVLGVVVNDASHGRTYQMGAYGGGAWQYATSAQRLLTSVRGASENGLGLARPALPDRRATDEPLELTEPDWSADVQRPSSSSAVAAGNGKSSGHAGS